MPRSLVSYNGAAVGVLTPLHSWCRLHSMGRPPEFAHYTSTVEWKQGLLFAANWLFASVDLHILGSMQISMRKLNSHTTLQLWCFCCVMYKLLYRSIRVRTAPPVSVRVRTRVNVSFSFTVLHVSRGLCDSGPLRYWIWIISTLNAQYGRAFDLITTCCS